MENENTFLTAPTSVLETRSGASSRFFYFFVFATIIAAMICAGVIAVVSGSTSYRDFVGQIPEIRIENKAVKSPIAFQKIEGEILGKNVIFILNTQIPPSSVSVEVPWGIVLQKNKVSLWTQGKLKHEWFLPQRALLTQQTYLTDIPNKLLMYVSLFCAGLLICGTFLFLVGFGQLIRFIFFPWKKLFSKE